MKKFKTKKSPGVNEFHFYSRIQKARRNAMLPACSICGRLRQSTEETWYTLHFGVNDLSLLCVASQDMIDRLGAKQACSRTCLHRLIHDWAHEWGKKKVAAAAMN